MKVYVVQKKKYWYHDPIFTGCVFNSFDLALTYIQNLECNLFVLEESRNETEFVFMDTKSNKYRIEVVELNRVS